MNIIRNLTIIFVLISFTLNAQLITYPQPCLNSTCLTASPKYTVQVRQGNGDWVNSYVNYSAGHNPGLSATPNSGKSNSWTSFSLNGTVEVKVKLTSGTINSCIVRPKSKGITVSISTTENAAIFTINEAGQYSVEINGVFLHAMLIFVNPLEKYIPTSSSTKLHYFGPGYHEIGLLYGDNIRIDAVNRVINEGDTIYIAGGAWLSGTISATRMNGPWNKVKNVTIMGRGVLSCINYPRKDNLLFDTDAFNYGIIRAGTGVKIDGITISDPQAYAVTSEDLSYFNNIKIMAWHYNTDAYTAYGQGAVIENSFSKVMDDHAKGDMPNTTIRNCVFFLQDNGAAFLMTYNSATSTVGYGVKMSNCDILHADNTYQAPVFGCQQGGGSTLSNFTFENIRIEGNCTRLFGMAVRNNAWADQTKLYGRVTNILFKDVTLEGKSTMPSYFWGRTGIDFMNSITFENLKYNNLIVNNPSEANIGIGPYVHNITFKANGQTVYSSLGMQYDQNTLKLLVPSADCPLNKQYPDVNYGAYRNDKVSEWWLDEQLQVYKNGSDEREGIIRFENLPDKTTYGKAILYFWGNQNWGSNGTISFTKLTDDSWNESTTTWNTSRSIAASPLTINHPFKIGLNSLDLTDIINTESDGKISIKLSAYNSGYYSDISTKEALTPVLMFTKIGATAVEEVVTPSVLLYPNPAKNTLHLRSSEVQNMSYAEFIDISGRVIARNAIENNSISLNNILNGIYLVKLYDSTLNCKINQRIVVKK